MANIFDLFDYKAPGTGTTTTTEEIENPVSQNGIPPMPPQEKKPEERKPGINVSGNYSSDPEQQKLNETAQYDQQQVGAFSDRLGTQQEAAEDSWSPDYTARQFLDEVGTSIMRGLGNHVVKGTGDMLQVGLGYFGVGDMVDGNQLSRYLQEAGGDFAEKFLAHMPEELQSQNITASSMLNPKFWSTHVAELIPQLAEFILISKGGSAVAKAGLKGAVKALPKSGVLGAVKTTTRGQAVFGSGSGLAGKVATDIGLTAGAETIAGAVGGGIAGNVFSGMLNAAELVNTNKAILDANGERVFTDEQLGEMATGTMRNNLGWLPMDVLSWGMTFGGGWKALNKLNPAAKGGLLNTAVQQSKVASSLFKSDMMPIIQSLGRISGKGVFEGVEESFQETFEDWAKMKAESSVTGKPMEFDSYWDFYKSKDNDATRTISFAVGALGGAAFNIGDLVNTKADENLKTYDRIKNLTGVIKNQGSESELSWQRYHIRQQLAEIVTEDRLSNDEKMRTYEEFTQSLIENGNITEDQKKEYDEMVNNFSQLKDKAKKLNVKGLDALMKNSAHEQYFTGELERFQELAKENIDTINSLEGVDQKVKEQRIQREKSVLQERINALSLAIAEAKQNQSNLLLGKLASPLTVEIKLDKYGNEIIRGGLNKADYQAYVDPAKMSAQERQQMEDEAGPSETELIFSKLSTSAKNIYNSLFKKKEAEIESVEKVVPNQKKGAEYANQSETEEVVDDTITPEDKANQQELKDREAAELAEFNQKQIGEGDTGIATVNNKVETPEEAEARNSAEQQAEEEVNRKSIDKDPNETIEDAVYEEFESSGDVDIKTLEDIAKKIHSETSLTEREDAIRLNNLDSIKKMITNEILGLKNNPDEFIEQKEEATKEEDLSDKDGNPIILDDSELTDKEKEFLKDQEKKTSLTDDEIKRIEQETGVKITPDGKPGGYAVKNADASKVGIQIAQAVKKAKGEIRKALEGKKTKKVLKTLAEVKKAAEEKAKKEWKPVKDRIVKSNEDFMFDKRGPLDALKMSTGKKNILASIAKKKFHNRIRNKNVQGNEQVSQNEMDRYLDTMSAKNLYAPSEIDAMSAINYRLKKMFPDMRKSDGTVEAGTQVFVVKNLFEALGSQGMATTVAGMVYVDAKNWHQDEVFMHEMSHVWYQMSKGEPMTQKLVEKALRNPELVKRTKEIYDDYILYDVAYEGEWYKVKKGDLHDVFGFDKNNVEAGIQELIKDGFIKAVPLSEQSMIIEEMFAKQLEGPLAENFDRAFNVKSEVQRQQDVKTWFGMIKKKGEIAAEDNGIQEMLNKAFEGIESGENLENFTKTMFRTVTEGIVFDSNMMDSRTEAIDQATQERYDAIAARRTANKDKRPTKLSNAQEEADMMDSYDTALEDDGEAFFDKDFDAHVKRATRVMKRFGKVYNKKLRNAFLKANINNVVDWRKQPTFDSDYFEAMVYRLATENNSSLAFIDQIQESEISEIQFFNTYMDTLYPDTKDQILSSMHFVMSNSKHVIGYRNTIDKNGNHKMVDSLSQSELNETNNVLARIKREQEGNSTAWQNFAETVKLIKNGSTETTDFQRVISMLTNFDTSQMYKEGLVSYQGVSLPIETLLAGYIKANKMFFNENPNSYVSLWNARPLIEAFINTNRKFTPFSAVRNAEGNMEPVRITNNNMTKEVDAIIDYLSPKEGEAAPTLEQFLDRFSHISKPMKGDLGKAYVNNQFLENIYNQFQRGVVPTISQYHGVQDTSNDNGSLYKNSTALEQGIEDFLTFVETSMTPNGKKRPTYSGNMGAFADSPRKFFMNMKRVGFEEVFQTNEDGSYKFHQDGKVMNSIFHMHQKMFGDQLNTKTKFLKEIRKALNENIEFFNENGKELSKVQKLKPYFRARKDGSMALNKAGQQLASEYAINAIVNGYNVSEVFLPGVKGGTDIIKRFKMNSSPVMSVKNPNFRTEMLFFADEIIDNSISGTDSGMYILREDAEKLQALGRGVFDLNDGFKLLNAHIEKDNPNFRGKTGYLKGYTTIIDEAHPLHKIMKARKDKYNAYHKEKYGVDPSMDLSDQSYNHMVIAVPQSSDKSNFSPNQFTTKKDGQLEYTEEGVKFTEQALNENIDDAMKHYDELYYGKDGNFIGLDSSNFGPQQNMDKQTDEASTPVQMQNSIVVNAIMNGKQDVADRIQSLISEQKQQNLQSILDQLDEGTIADYKKFIEEGMSKEDMDQGQRLMMEDGGSISHPYINEIAVNQFTKTLRKAGNKLFTPGTYAQQKPDSGFRAKNPRANGALKGYTENMDGSLNPAEIVVPNHMRGKVRERELLTITNAFGKQAVRNGESNLGKTQKETFLRLREQGHDLADLMLLELAALEMARKRFKLTSDTEAQKHIGKEMNEQGVVIGYHVKGDKVIASRVPGHGPSSTGIFEVLGFDDSSNGNQTMVSSEFNDIIGSDNDGDALFIQTKGDKGFAKWNEAFDLITDYWLSKEMAPQIQAKIDFEKSTEDAIKKVNSVFPVNDEYRMPFSPLQRMDDYDNTMVSKRNVGPVFNIHKITNLLANARVSASKTISIGNTNYDLFEDTVSGNESRNQQSAILANIILDNAKHGYADSLGLNENNISQAVLLTNLGVPLDQIGLILNSRAAKLWNKKFRNNTSMFHDSVTKGKAIDQMYKEIFGVKRPKNRPMKLDTSKITEKNQQAAVIEIMDYLSNMNSDIQAISKIMSGHKSIHVNPLILEKQLKNYRDVVNNKNKEGTLLLNEDFKNNPDLKNYVDVAEKVLNYTKRINPVYRDGTNKVISDISARISEDLSERQLDEISKDIMKFNASRLLRLNNMNKAYVKNMMDPNSKTSIYKRLDDYTKSLREDVVVGDDIRNSVSKLHNSVLFRKALNYNFAGTSNNLYISANPNFANESVTQVEREVAQQEFDELPNDIKNDLIVYDLIKNGWKGPQSMALLFGDEVNKAINRAADMDISNKNNDMSPVVQDKLRRIIALKRSQQQSNPFDKVYLDFKENIKNDQHVIDKIFKDDKLVARISEGKPMYINVIDQNGRRSLFEMEEFTKEEVGRVVDNNSQAQKTAEVLRIARDKMKRIPNDLTGNGDMDIALIEDRNLGGPYETRDTKPNTERYDPLVEATIKYEENMERVKRAQETGQMMDAREDFYEDTFTRAEPLTFEQFEKAKEYDQIIPKKQRETDWQNYLNEKKKANEIAHQFTSEEVVGMTTEQLMDVYEHFAEKDVYAYSNIITPVIKQIAVNQANEQMKLHENIKEDGKDISYAKSFMMTGSTIPANHPASQALAKQMELEFKKFTSEKRKYNSKLNELTDKLYQEKLGFSNARGFKTILKRAQNFFTKSKQSVYDQLYGNMVEIKEYVDENGRPQMDYKLKTREEFDRLHKAGLVTDTEKAFYDYFREITDKLAPKDLKTREEDYIPHTAMGNFEMLSARGILGMMLNARGRSEHLQEVKLKSKDKDGNDIMKTFKHIEDEFKILSGTGKKNSLSTIKEYRAVKKKAEGLLKQGLNEDGTKIIFGQTQVETALGFGAMNRFANNRSLKSKELPSMDLNKALSDYVHSTLFVNGNENFQGMKKLQVFIEGTLAHNADKGYVNMNRHVQQVWKDYFLRGKRQESILGKKMDRMILGLTRLNLFYALGYQANVNTKGMYVGGNILAGKYHNIKDVGGKAFLKGESRYWGLDSFEGGIPGMLQRQKRIRNIIKNINFMEINVYDEVNMEKKNGLDAVITDIALGPMILSERWIQRTHMLGLMTDEQLNKFDENGNYKTGVEPIDNLDLIKLEDQVKRSHGRGYQPTDQRAIQLVSWGSMMMQFARFIPTMFQDRLAKADVNIYGQETIGSLRAVHDMVRKVVNDPKGFAAYRNSLSPEMRKQLDNGIKGMGMAALISVVAATANSDVASDTYWDTNYYFDLGRLKEKLINPPAVRSTTNLVNSLF